MQRERIKGMTDGLYELKTLFFHILDAFPGKDYEIDPSALRSEYTLPKRNVPASETEQNYDNRYRIDVHALLKGARIVSDRVHRMGPVLF